MIWWVFGSIYLVLFGKQLYRHRTHAKNKNVLNPLFFFTFLCFLCPFWNVAANNHNSRPLGNACLVSGNILLSNWWVHLPHRELCDVNSLQPSTAQAAPPPRAPSSYFLLLLLFCFFLRKKSHLLIPPPPFNLYSSLYHSFPMAALLFFFVTFVVGFSLGSCRVTWPFLPAQAEKKNPAPLPNALKVCTGYITAVLCLSKVMRIHFNCLIIIIVAVPLARDSLLPKKWKAVLSFLLILCSCCCCWGDECVVAFRPHFLETLEKLVHHFDRRWGCWAVAGPSVSIRLVTLFLSRSNGDTHTKHYTGDGREREKN